MADKRRFLAVAARTPKRTQRVDLPPQSAMQTTVERGTILATGDTRRIQNEGTRSMDFAPVLNLRMASIR